MSLLVAYQNPRIPFIFDSAERNDVSLVLIKPPEDDWTYFHALKSVIHVAEIDLLDDDQEAVMCALDALCDQFGVEGCLACVDEVVGVISTFCARRGFNGNPSSCAVNLKSKPNMRRAMAGDPSNPNFLEIPDAADLQSLNLDDLDYPYIVKPAAGFASMGVTRVNDRAGLIEALEFNRRLNNERLIHYTAQADRGKSSTIIEQFICGEEYIVDGVSCDGIYQMLCITAKGASEGPYFEDSTHVTATELDRDSVERIYDSVSRALASLELHNGPSHTEIRLYRNQVYIIETANRVGGSGVCDFFVRESTGVDYYGLIFAISLGRCSLLDASFRPHYKKVATNLIIAVGAGGEFVAIEGTERIATLDGYHSLMTFFRVGAHIPAFPDFVGFPGFILGVHNSFEAGNRFMAEAASKVRATYRSRRET